MSTEAFEKELACPKDGNPRAIKDVIRQKKLGFMQKTASEALEKEHLKLAETETDELKKEIHRQMAIAQAKMRKEGLVKLQLRCPDHPGKGEYSFFPEDLPQNAPLIKEHVLRCLKCGDPVTLENTKTSGSFKVLNIRCPTHGTGQRKISASIHDAIMLAPITAEPKPDTPPPPTEEASQPEETIATNAGEVAIKFCWNCGAKTIAQTSQYCHKCGVALKPP
jgi:hypothetical protein